MCITPTVKYVEGSDNKKSGFFGLFRSKSKKEIAVKEHTKEVTAAPVQPLSELRGRTMSAPGVRVVAAGTQSGRFKENSVVHPPHLIHQSQF